MDPVVVSDVEVQRRGRVVLEDVSFTARAGQVLVVLGPNGAGKTTLLETLEGYLPSTRGSVRVLGLDPRDDQSRLVDRVGVLLQDGGLYPSMSPVRALRLNASYYDDPRDVDEMLELVGLTEAAHVPAKRLSGGQCRRLALALALVGRPAVAFLDEPTSGVDPEGRLLIRSVLDQLLHEGTCVILSTHELDEAERVADQLVLLRAGRLVGSGSPAEVLGEATQIRFAARSGLDVAMLAARLGAPVVEERPGEYRVDTSPDPGAIAALAGWLAEHGIAIGELRAARRRLEEVYLELTAADIRPDSHAGKPKRRQRNPERG